MTNSTIKPIFNGTSNLNLSVEIKDLEIKKADLTSAEIKTTSTAKTPIKINNFSSLPYLGKFTLKRGIVEDYNYNYPIYLLGSKHKYLILICDNNGDIIFHKISNSPNINVFKVKESLIYYIDNKLYYMKLNDENKIYEVSKFVEEGFKYLHYDKITDSIIGIARVSHYYDIEEDYEINLTGDPGKFNIFRITDINLENEVATALFLSSDIPENEIHSKLFSLTALDNFYLRTDKESRIWLCIYGDMDHDFNVMILNSDLKVIFVTGVQYNSRAENFMFSCEMENNEILSVSNHLADITCKFMINEIQ